MGQTLGSVLSSPMAHFIFMVDGGTLFLLAGLFFNTAIYRKRGRQDDRFFSLMLLTLFPVTASDLLGNAILNTKIWGELPNAVNQMLYLMGLALFGYFWMRYLICRYQIKRDERFMKRIAEWLWAPIALIWLMIAAAFIGFVRTGFDAQEKPLAILFLIIFCAVSLLHILCMLINFQYAVAVRKDGVYVWLYLLPVLTMINVPLLGGFSINSLGLATMLVYMHMGRLNEAFFKEVD